MSSKRFLATASALFAFLIACSSVEVSVDWDRDADFTKYQTFSFLKRPDEGGARGGGRKMSRQANPLFFKHCESAVRAELTGKGMREAEGGRADMRIAIHAGSKEQVDVNNWGYVGPRGYWHHGGTTVSKYQEGRLTIDFVDGASKSIVFRGIGKAVMDPDAHDEQIREIVHEVLERYPPKP